MGPTSGPWRLRPRAWSLKNRLAPPFPGMEGSGAAHLAKMTSRTACHDLHSAHRASAAHVSIDHMLTASAALERPAAGLLHVGSGIALLPAWPGAALPDQPTAPALLVPLMIANSSRAITGCA